MSAGKLSAEGLRVLHGEPLDARLRFENVLLRDCLELAVMELRAADWPGSMRLIATIQQRIRSAGLAPLRPDVPPPEAP